ncbi:MAG: hypothetical protein RLZZ251_752 [Actinomycetota bacterium]
MKVAVASSSPLALPTLEILIKNGYELVAGISMPDRPRGRGREISPNEFSIALEKMNIAVAKPTTDDQLRECLERLAPHVVITVSYGKLIKPRELSIPPLGWLNLHFSLLPKYRGAAPVQRAILNGDPITGITVFKLDAGMDTGPIYSTREISLVGRETSGILLEKLSEMGATAVLEALQRIEAGDPPSLQSAIGASLAPKISSADAKIDWNNAAIDVDRKVRAFNPKPGAWTELAGQRIRLCEGVPHLGWKLAPGAIDISSGVLLIGCRDGAFEVSTLIPEGKREMRSQDWLRGARLSGQEMFR